jgi:PAS domain S-box-containing protein
MRALRVVAVRRKITPTVAVRQAVELYTTLYGPWPALIFTKDREFTIRFANRAALAHLGYSFVELFGHSMFDVYTPEMRSRLEIVAEFTANERVRGIKVETLRSSGEIVPMILWAHLDRDLTDVSLIMASWVTPEEAEDWRPSMLT